MESVLHVVTGGAFAAGLLLGLLAGLGMMQVAADSVCQVYFGENASYGGLRHGDGVCFLEETTRTRVQGVP